MKSDKGVASVTHLGRDVVFYDEDMHAGAITEPRWHKTGQLDLRELWLRFGTCFYAHACIEISRM